MSIRKIHVIFIVLALGLWMSCSERNDGAPRSGGAVQQDEANPGDPSTHLPDNGRQVEIVGIVEQVQDDFAIWTLTETFIVEDSDLSGLVGKHVKVRGSLGQIRGRPSIHINDIQEIK
jgi:hypothetical protein